MARIFRIIFGLVSAIAAAWAGNWIGGQLRYLLTGERTQSLHFVHTASDGKKIDNYPVITKFYPGLLLGLAGRPRWLTALLGGTIAGLFVDDKYEAMLLEHFIAPLVPKPGKPGAKTT